MVSSISSGNFSDIKLRASLYSRQILLNSMANSSKNTAGKSFLPDSALISEEAQKTLLSYYERVNSGTDNIGIGEKLGDMWMDRYENADNPMKKMEYLNLAIQEYSQDIDSPSAYVKLGKIYEDLGMEDKSIAAYQRALSLDGENYEALVAMGDHYRNSGDNERAESYYQMAQKSNPFDYNSYLKMADMKLEEGKRSEALEIINKGLKYNPDNKELSDMKKEVESGTKL
jgi:tetratricopeptide (TPR) repeat protein